MNRLRYRPQHHPYPITDYRPWTPLRNVVNNFFGCGSARTQSPIHHYWTNVIPVTMTINPQYVTPPAMQVDPVLSTQPSSYYFQDAYQNETASTVLGEDGPSSYPANVTYAPRLSHTSLPPVPWTVPLSWTSFRQLELTRPINSNECLLILQGCSLLIDLKLTLAEVERNPLPTVPSSVEARNLRSLTIHSFCGTEWLFQSLRLPQLTSIHLSLAPLDEPPTDIGLHSLLSRSRCSMQTLSLTNVFLQESELIDCLKVMSKDLEELVVRNDRKCLDMRNERMISDVILSCLTRTGSPTKHDCPKLKTLNLSPCVSADGRLAEMLASRSNTMATGILNFAYSFIDLSLHTSDIQYLAENDTDLNVTHLIHELY